MIDREIKCKTKLAHAHEIQSRVQPSDSVDRATTDIYKIRLVYSVIRYNGSEQYNLMSVHREWNIARGSSLF